MPRKQTVVEITPKSVKKSLRKLKKINQEYRKSVFTVLSLSLDHIRQVAADKYILRNIVGKKKSPWRMAREQPAHPTKLTERTGRLLIMMKDRQKWHGIKNTLLQTTVTAVQRTMGLRGRILAKKEGRNINEGYEATLRAFIDPSNPFLGKGFVGGGRIIEVINGKVIRAPRKVETKQTLRARFLHEHGLRGRVRQSFTPAAKEEDIRLSHLMEKRLARILKVRQG